MVYFSKERFIDTQLIQYMHLKIWSRDGLCNVKWPVSSVFRSNGLSQQSYAFTVSLISILVVLSAYSLSADRKGFSIRTLNNLVYHYIFSFLNVT